LRGQARLAIAKAVQLEQTGLTDWTIGTLPQQVQAEQAGNTVAGYPALVDEGDGVSVRVLTSRSGQARAHWGGTRRLLLLAAPSTRKALTRSMSNDTKLAIARTRLGSVDALLDDATNAAIDHLIDQAGGPPWDDADFRSLQRLVRDDLVDTVARIGADVGRIVVAASAVEARLAKLTAPAVQPSVADAHAQLQRLVRPGFVSASGMHRLPDVLRYVRGIERRLEKLPAEPFKDAQKMKAVQALERDRDALLQRLPTGPARSEARRLSWQLEELRVSLFAQVLGTNGSISEQRIRKELTALAAR
jgi:ATP-dependent helicase HrpA